VENPLLCVGSPHGLHARYVLDAIAGNGKSKSVLEKLGEVEAELDPVTRRITEARSELPALDGQVIDEDDRRAALASFEPVRDHLVPAKKARVLQRLINTVIYDAGGDTVEIDFHPGVRTLAEEKERDTA